MSEQLFDYETAAPRLKVSTRHLKDLVYRGEIGHVKLGRLVRFRESDLDAFIAARAVRPRSK